MLSFLTLFAFLTTNLIFAEEQVPLGVHLVESNPYYFSEGGLGIEILKYFDRPLNPYLVHGKTTDESSTEEIYQAYTEQSKNYQQKAIVDDNNRAMAFTVDFSNGDIKTKQTFNTFSKFTHIDKNTRTPVPYNYDNISYGLELESLPSDDKKSFYENLVKLSINPGKKPEPFDIDIKILTGDGSTLQLWQYQKCVINSYTPYLDESLFKVKFDGSLSSEIRDKTTFSCTGFKQDFVLKEPIRKSDSLTVPILPSKETRADRVLVQFSGGEFQNVTSFDSFSKFVPISKNPNFPISIPGNVIGEKPRFALEANPTKDKQPYYKQISRYINPGKTPEPFDATIYLITGANNVLQTWKYTDCTAYNYATFFTDNNLVYKFIHKAGSEIREKTFFECSGLLFNPDMNLKELKTGSAYVPDDSSRAMVFSVHFEGADIAPAKTITSFSKFGPVIHEEMQLLIPNAPFGDEPKFYLDSLPGKDNQWYYQLMSKYINAGKIPEPFQVTISVMTGDATTLQNWKYSDCQVLSYKTFYSDTLILRTFTDTSHPEYRDRTIFQCTGLSFDGTSFVAEKTPEKSLYSVDFIPSSDSRIKNIVTTFSGGDFTEPLKIYTIGKFTPKVDQRSETSVRLVKFSTTIISNTESGASPTTYGGDGGHGGDCRDGDCGDGGHGGDCRDGDCGDCRDGDCGGGEIPIDPEIPPVVPEEPGVPGSSSIVLVSTPHLSTMQQNDYVKSTEFTITSLPSKDKTPYYDHVVSKFINPGKAPEPFDVTFDYVSGDGTVLQSWNYADCDLKNFDLKFADSILSFSLSGRKGISDIVDVSTFRCNGFSVNLDQRKSNIPQDTVTVPSLYDMATLNIVSLYGGELQNERTSALVQEVETHSDSNISLGGLPNAQHKDGYDFISRYLNPGKTPELIDVRIDTVTGDGTILYSTVYGKCNVDNAALYYNDGMAIIRYVPGLKPEIRGQSILDCAGESFKTSPQKDPLFYPTGNLKKISPMIQRAVGIPSEGVVCAEGHDLMIRPPKNVPLCVKTEHVSKFEQSGWMKPSEREKRNLSDVMQTILPTNDERAASFTITFEGTDITPAQTVKTFSKFVPIANENSAVLRPSTPLDSSAKAFYLESLSSKDKSWYYELAGRYVNAGVKPELFNVMIEVNDGKGDVLQTWKYRECAIDNFVTYYDDSLFTYKMHQKWQSEFKDKSIFSCAGLTINS
ncbi:MAG: hypothetical protein D4R96_02635 [Nitrosopumilaceae archaeon]|nr:MAG: hypothetical protein D4R96_02635 [Nitrosopumilaceae archaeon]